MIVQDGLRRMYAEQEIDLLLHHRDERELRAAGDAARAWQQGIIKGMYLLQIGGRGKVRVNLMGSGTILREVLAAASASWKRTTAFPPMSSP